MRRALAAVAIGGVLLTGSACSSHDKAGAAATPSPTPAASPTPTGPDYTANTALVCGKLRTIFSDDVAAFGTQMGKMIADKEAKAKPEAAAAQKAAQAQLKTVGEKIRTETSAALDPELQQAGATSADKFATSAADTKLFDSIKSTTDLTKVMQGQMAEWLTPVAGYCA
jgi:hypothetical protein